MKLTYNTYIQNPIAKGNSVFSQRELYRDHYTKKLDKLLVRENNKIDYTLYYSKEDYYIHMKVPSETVEKFYYDVVVRFYTDQESAKLSANLNDYYVQFYSNSPDFVFTYAYVFRDKELFIEDLKPKMSKRALKETPDVRNPEGVVGYVKGIYFCYLIMKNRSLFIKSKYKLYGSKYNKKILLNEIEYADDKIAKRKEEEEKKKKKEKKEKAKKQEERYKHDDQKLTKTTIKTTPTVKAKSFNTTKKSKKTSVVKKK